MRRITALIPFLLMVVVFLACNKTDDKISDLESDVADLQDLIDADGMDSLAFVLALNEQEYKKYIDSLRRADSLAFGEGRLPFTYNVLVYDGSTTSITTDGYDDRVAQTEAFDAEVEVSVAQYGNVRTLTTTDGMASFDDIGIGIVKVTIKSPGYTTLSYSFETTIDPSVDYYEDAGSSYCFCKQAEDFWKFVKDGNIGHDVAIFATEGTLASTLTGRAFVETDLTDMDQEVVPEGTILTAAIDVEDSDFEHAYILTRNKQIFTDNILSFGYDPIFSATVDANGDFTFTLAGAAYEDGIPYIFEYSDFLAGQIAFEEETGEVTSVTEQTIFGPDHAYTLVPTVTQQATVSFDAGGGATAALTTSGDGSIIDIDVVNAGQDFQGVPRVIIQNSYAASGSPAAATATVTADGRIDEITLSDNGLGYPSAPVPTVTITEGTGATAVVTALASNSSNGGVASVSVQTSGNGFASAPNVIFSSNTTLDSATIANYLASQTDPPSATATINSNGTVEAVTVDDSGSDLGGAPSVIITSGFGGVATVTDTVAGAITGITITVNGDYYTDIPTAVTLTGTGTGATFTVTLNANGELASVAASGGTGYIPGDQIEFVGIGSGATATAHYQGESIEDYTITNPGTLQSDGMYYSNAPEILFPEPAFKGTGSVRAEGTAVLDGEGRLIGITITEPGSGYYGSQLTPTMAITIISGSGATATAVIEPVKITEIDVTNSGGGYIVAPTVAIYDASGTGSGATATAVLMNGQVTSITLNTEGANYTNPQIAILDPGTSFNPGNWDGDADEVVFSNPATADVVVVDGVITGITITSIGDNYPTGTRVVLNALRGTGFSATSVVAGGRVTGVTIDAGGEDYIGGNLPSTMETFQGLGSYNAKTSITRVRDIYYGTGARRNNPTALP